MKQPKIITVTKLTNFDVWCSTKNMKRMPHTIIQNGNCLYESAASFFDIWRAKPIELRLSTVRWAQRQILARTPWGFLMMDKFERMS